MSTNDSDDNKSSKPKFDIESYWQSIKGKWVKTDLATKVTATQPRHTKFVEDRARGHNGEHDFYIRYASCLVRTNGHRGDFEILKTSEKLELKSDFYDPAKTENFFMERYSYDSSNGGVWQAADHGVDYYIYWFPLTGETHIFNVKQLIRKLNKLTKNLDLISIKNNGYWTRGYKVPRELLKSIELAPEEIGLYAK